MIKSFKPARKKSEYRYVIEGSLNKKLKDWEDICIETVPNRDVKEVVIHTVQGTFNLKRNGIDRNRFRFHNPLPDDIDLKSFDMTIVTDGSIEKCQIRTEEDCRKSAQNQTL